MNSIPIVTQLKSAVLALSGDMEGARSTQIEFAQTCLFISQITSLVYSIKGNNQEARNVQKRFLRNAGNMVNGIPVVGHMKGAVHYSLGDKNGGHQAMKDASRSVGKHMN